MHQTPAQPPRWSPDQAATGAPLAVALLRRIAAARRGALATGYAHHAGAHKAYLDALGLLCEQCPHALQVAVAVLNDHLETLPAGHVEQRCAAESVQIASDLVAALERDPVHAFDDRVLPVDLHRNEAVARADVVHAAALHATPGSAA